MEEKQEQEPNNGLLGPSEDSPPLRSESPPPPSEPLSGPLSYLHQHEIDTMSLSKWESGISQHKEQLSDWFVTKLEHMKSFHFSCVMHEYLRVTVKQRGQPDSDPPTIVFVERMIGGDEVTVGWTQIERRDIPKLTGWWVKRWMRGYFGDNVHGLSVLASSSSVQSWKAVNYSASDYLCHLDFAEPGVSLSDFAQVLVESSATVRNYKVTSANCFWFAFTVYERMRTDFSCNEVRGGYYKHRGKFAGLHILPWNLAQDLMMARDIHREKKKAEKRHTDQGEEERMRPSGTDDPAGGGAGGAQMGGVDERH